MQNLRCQMVCEFMSSKPSDRGWWQKSAPWSKSEIPSFLSMTPPHNLSSPTHPITWLSILSQRDSLVSVRLTMDLRPATHHSHCWVSCAPSLSPLSLSQLLLIVISAVVVCSSILRMCNFPSVYFGCPLLPMGLWMSSVECLDISVPIWLQPGCGEWEPPVTCLYWIFRSGLKTLIQIYSHLSEL
jgi:hypothetical protein